MVRNLKKPITFILTLSLVFGMFVDPSFAYENQLYKEASIVNGVDTSFENQSEIADIKAVSQGGIRTLSQDSHSGRFSLKIGKQGLTSSIFCTIISTSIDRSKYNQVSMWIKPNAYNSPFELYTKISGVQTKLGTITVDNLKANVWQQVTFDLKSFPVTTMPGLYTYTSTNNNSLLIDDICLTKSYCSTVNWDLNSVVSSGGLELTSGTGITLRKNDLKTAYWTDPRICYIQNNLAGQIKNININSGVTNIASTSEAVFLNNIVATNPALFSMSKDCSKIFYSDKGLNYWIKLNDRFFNTTRLIYDSPVKMVKTNEDGSKLAFVYDTALYFVNDTSKDIRSNQIYVTNGALSYLLFRGSNLYYISNNILYGRLTNLNSISDKITNVSFSGISYNDINYLLDINPDGNYFIYVDNYSSIYQINKTYSYDKELLMQLTPSSITKPESKYTIKRVRLSTLPNQVIAQAENGDIYSIDTKTKTSRLLVSGMVLYDVLEGGKLLLSDMNDTGRFLFYDPTANSKEVFRLDNRSTGSAFTVQYSEKDKTVIYLNNENKMQVIQLSGADTKDKYALMLNNDNKWWVYKDNVWLPIYTGSDCPSINLMENMGMTAAEVNAITEKDFQKLPENTQPNTLKIAIYIKTNNQYVSPVLKSINVSTNDTAADLDSKTAYGTRIKEYNKADFRDISAIHVTENKDSSDEIYYFLAVDDALYSIRYGEVCDIGKDATQLFGNVKDNYMDVMSYGMSAKELADFPPQSLKQILITDNTTDKFGIVAVIKTIDKDTKDVKLDYALESLQKRFEDSVTTIKITLTDDTLIQYTSGEVSKEEIEKFADWIMDRKYNRGPVFFTFHVGNQYKIINYYMIKMFSVE